MILPNRPCPVCRGQKKQIVYRQRFSRLSDQFQLEGYDVAVCNACGAAYADRIPEQVWFDSYYGEVSKYSNRERQGEESESDSARFRDIAQSISRYFPDKISSILEIGCATGGLLRRLKDLGYVHLLGMDKSRLSAEIAADLHGIRVIDLSLSEIRSAEGPVDLLIQVGVLEHIRDLEAALAEMRSLIRPDGLMYVEVPDVEGFADCAGAPFQQFSVEHINFFSSRSLIALMARHGFSPAEVTRTERNHTRNTRMPVVCGFFRRVEEFGTDDSLDASSLAAVRRYIDQSESGEVEIRRVVGALVALRQPVLVWGVGTQTLHLMATEVFAELDIIAFVDSNPAYQGRHLHGKPVLPPSELHAYPHPILISSQVFQSEIIDQIKRQLNLPNEVFTLYPT